MVQYKVTRRDEQPVCQWAGGITRQFYIYPEGSEGGISSDYDFEITTSTMDYPETEYTIYKDYDRILMIIDGETTLTYEDGSKVNLKKYEYNLFSGDMRTYSKGLATDYELMIRKGNKGIIRTIIAGEKPLLFETKREDGYSFMYCGVYCDGKYCEIQVKYQKFSLRHGDHLSIVSTENITYNVMGDGFVINSAICFNPM